MAKNHRNPSVMNHSFAEVPKAEIPRSSFDRSHGKKTTFDAGELIPLFVDWALPGDTFNLSMTGFARLATPIHPVMDNMYMDTHFFSVPIRLIWDNFQKFMGEQDNPGDSIDYLLPIIKASATGHDYLSVYDQMGIPPKVPNLEHSALPLRAMNLIFNEWFRDQNLQDSVKVNKGDGPDDPADYELLRRGKRHDYFTSALPWPQKGPGVQIPLGSVAPVESDGSAIGLRPVSSGTVDGVMRYTSASGFTGLGAAPTTGWTLPSDVKFGANTGLQVDLSDATSATINSLRQAFAVQKLFERDARGGTRYTEIIRAHFGVTSPDARLQRPEYLGGGSSPINISPIPQTNSTDATSPQGNLAAYGTALLNNHGFTMSFTEHCIVIGFVSVRADLTYQQGLGRLWSQRTKLDLYWPALAHIGEQTVLRKEIYATGVPANDDAVFGYQERYAEYRYKPSEICGVFRSTFPQTLDSWHLSQKFATAPVLGSDFIEEHPPLDRVIAVSTQPHFLFDSYFQFRCARPMPIYGVPGFMDRF